MDAAGQLNDQATATALAKEGNKSYGAEDISFLATLINAELQKDNYPACYEAIDESFAIAANDSIKSQLYNIKGIINVRSKVVPIVDIPHECSYPRDQESYRILRESLRTESRDV